VVIGQGEQMEALQKIAGPTISFLGAQPDKVVHEHYASCRALLFPGEEDIGLTPIEAQASGRPVIAYGRGGALETVIGFEANNGLHPENSTGVFFDEQSVDSMIQGIQSFEAVESQFSPNFLRAHARRFDASEFKKLFAEYVAQKLADFQNETSPFETPDPEKDTRRISVTA
jgi:glycosyltransferase involved in cell wall biosynthesis